MVLPLQPPAVPPGDGALIQAALSGQDQAREELVRTHRRAAYLLALQLLRNREDAMDVTQEALLRFVVHLPRFDTRRPVRPWLLKIVHNQVRDFLRRRRVRPTVPLEAPEGNLADSLADPVSNPEADARRRQLQRRVWEALSRLSEKHREIVVLRDFHDLSYREIAEILGIPRGTVMSRLHAARKALRQVVLASPELAAARGGAAHG